MKFRASIELQLEAEDIGGASEGTANIESFLRDHFRHDDTLSVVGSAVGEAGPQHSRSELKRLKALGAPLHDRSARRGADGGASGDGELATTQTKSQSRPSGVERRAE